MGQPVISVRDLVKTYGKVEAVRGIDLEVGAGEIFGFLGPNGAGKSTTISILCTLVRPTSGVAQVAGIDVLKDPSAVRARIGLVFPDPPLAGRPPRHEELHPRPADARSRPPDAQQDLGLPARGTDPRAHHHLHDHALHG